MSKALQAIPTEKIYPLTQAQLGIWLGQQKSPESSLYLAAEFIEFRGTIDQKKFQQAIREVYSSASALHMNIRLGSQGEPQQVYQAKPISLEFIDFKNKTTSNEALNYVLTWAKTNLTKPINLETDSLFRNVLIQINEQHFFWYQCIHHSVCDGYGFALLSQKVSERYQILMGNTVAKDLKPLIFKSFEHVILEDEKYIQSKKHETSQAFWQQHLNHMPPPVSFSTSTNPCSRTAIKINHLLDATTYQALQSVATHHNARWPDVLIATIAQLLAQSTASTQLTLGLPFMGRFGSPLVHIPAMVMNINPLYLQLSNCRDFIDILQEVSKKQALIQRHRHYRYEHLQDDLALTQKKQRLFGPVVNIMPFDRNVTFTDTQSSWHGITAGPVEDISFSFVLDAQSQLQFSIEANPDRYTLTALERIQTHCLQLLSAILQNPQQPIKAHYSQLSYLTNPPLPASPYTHIIQALLSNAGRAPEKTALVTYENNAWQHISYFQLMQDSQRFAFALKDALSESNKATGLIVLALNRSYAAIVACLGTLFQGSTYAFIDPLGPLERNQAILSDLDAELVINNDENSLSVPTDIQSKVYHYDSFIKHTKLPLVLSCFNETTANKLAYIVYTSGSTGKPKGVAIDHKALLSFVESATQVYDIQNQDRILQFAPLHFDTFVEEMFCSLYAGSTLVLRQDNMLDSVENFLTQCSQLTINILDLPTAYWHELVFSCHAQQQCLPECIKTLIIGGEAVWPERLQQWHTLNENHSSPIRLLNTYGPSEATVVASYAELHPQQTLSIGRPLAGRSLAVVNEHGHILPRGEAGELLIMGTGLATGYHKLDMLSKERFPIFDSFIIPHHQTEQRAYHTGDRVRLDETHHIEFLGRMDDEVKISGQRINPLEIETVLLSIPSITQVAVLVEKHQTAHPYLMACLVPTTNSKNITDEQHKALWLSEIKQTLSQKLSAVMIPSIWTVLDTLPLNSSGKIDRKALAQHLETLKSNKQNEAQSVQLSHHERQIAEIWQSVLGVDLIQKQDDFFELGGQSLQTIQVANHLSVLTGKTVPVSDLFQNPSLEGLAETLFGNGPARTQEQLQQQVIQDSTLNIHDFPPLPTTITTPANTLKRVLLSGATGFVGAHLLHQLLTQTQAHITCLVRADNQQHAQQRLQDGLEKQALLKTLSHEQLQRIDIILADLAQEDLGLSDTQKTQLSANCDAIIHNAASISILRDYQSLRAVNLGSTQALLKLSVQRRIPLHFVSTIAIGHGSSEHNIKESFIDWHSGLKDGYQQSKWAAEHTLHQAIQRGYPVSIYRLGRVIGSYEQAYVNGDDLVWRIIRTAIDLGVYLELPIDEPWMAVDHIASSMVHIIQQPSAPQVYHLTPEQTIKLPKLFQWLKTRGYALDAVSLPQWCEKLAASQNPEHQALYGFFQQQQLDTKDESYGRDEPPMQFDNKHFQTMTQDLALPRESMNPTLFNRYIDYAIAHHLIPAPKQVIPKEPY